MSKLSRSALECERRVGNDLGNVTALSNALAELILVVQSRDPISKNNIKPAEPPLVNLTASLALRRVRRTNSLIFSSEHKNKGNATPP